MTIECVSSSQFVTSSSENRDALGARAVRSSSGKGSDELTHSHAHPSECVSADAVVNGAMYLLVEVKDSEQ